MLPGDDPSVFRTPERARRCSESRRRSSGSRSALPRKRCEARGCRRRASCGRCCGESAGWGATGGQPRRWCKSTRFAPRGVRRVRPHDGAALLRRRARAGLPPTSSIGATSWAGLVREPTAGGGRAVRPADAAALEQSSIGDSYPKLRLLVREAEDLKGCASPPTCAAAGRWRCKSTSTRSAPRSTRGCTSCTTSTSSASSTRWPSRTTTTSPTARWRRSRRFALLLRHNLMLRDLLHTRVTERSTRSSAIRHAAAAGRRGAERCLDGHVVGGARFALDLVVDDGAPAFSPPLEAHVDGAIEVTRLVRCVGDVRPLTLDVSSRRPTSGSTTSRGRTCRRRRARPRPRWRRRRLRQPQPTAAVAAVAVAADLVAAAAVAAAIGGRRGCRECRRRR